MSVKQILIDSARWIFIYRYDLRGRCLFGMLRQVNAYLLYAPWMILIYYAPRAGHSSLMLHEIDPYLTHEADA